MEQFKDYLQQKKYYPSTVHRSIKQVNKFLEWLQMQYGWGVQEIENVQYKHVLNFVSHEKARGMSVRTLHVSIGSINQYFEHLRNKNIVQHNPAKALRIKGATTTITQNQLSYQDLENLYQGYQAISKALYSTTEKNCSTLTNYIKQKSILTHQRNGIIVSMLVYQALTSGELERIQVEDINLTDGTVYIASSANTNNRILKLHTAQILPLYSYLHGGARDTLKAMPASGTPTKYRQEEKYQNSLFLGKMYNVVKQIMEELRGINPQLKNAQHIRASVILYWLKLHNKRQVQYMAGHKYIDSTEKYAVQEMDSLTDALTKYHPFG